MGVKCGDLGIRGQIMHVTSFTGRYIVGAAGDSPLLLSLIDIDRKELQQRGEGEYFVWFAL